MSIRDILKIFFTKVAQSRVLRALHVRCPQERRGHVAYVARASSVFCAVFYTKDVSIVYIISIDVTIKITITVFIKRPLQYWTAALNK